jgi:hypothetical protein
VLVAHEVRGLEAHLLAAGAKGVPPEVLRENRGWSEEAWEAGAGELAARGLLHADGRVTDAGRTLHASIETETDALAEPAYASLSEGALDDLYDALRACAAEVQASGLYPFPNPMGLPAL